MSLGIETAEGVLTVEMLYDAIRAIEEAPAPEPHRHIVSAAGAKRLSEGRQALCHECGQLVGR